MTTTVLITRPAEAAHRFAARISDLCGPDTAIVIAPLMRIVHDGDLPPLDGIRTLIFTSRHAVEAFAEQTGARDFVCYAVGNATACAARQAGFNPISCDGAANDLTNRMIADRVSGPCLYLRGEHTAADIAGRLSTSGIETREAVLYRQDRLSMPEDARTLLSRADSVVLPVFSPRSATVFFDLATPAAPLLIAAISKNAAQAVPDGRAAMLRIALRPTSESMLSLVCDLVAEANRLEGKKPAK